MDEVLVMTAMVERETPDPINTVSQRISPCHKGLYCIPLAAAFPLTTVVEQGACCPPVTALVVAGAGAPAGVEELLGAGEALVTGAVRVLGQSSQSLSLPPGACELMGPPPAAVVER